MSPKRIFFSIFQLSTFFSTHLILEALLITWGRLQDGSEYIRFRSSVVRSSKVVTVLLHSVQRLSSAVEKLWTILRMPVSGTASITSCEWLETFGDVWILLAYLWKCFTEILSLFLLALGISFQPLSKINHTIRTYTFPLGMRMMMMEVTTAMIMTIYCNLPYVLCP